MKHSITSIPLEEWGFGFSKPIFISGPCSVESPEQVMETAIRLKDSPVDILRGGIWKPRTRPNSFEGIGKDGLKWLKEAGDAIGKPVCVEVARASHVYEALRMEIDILWIGARTTVNPFAVQEIADALRGINVPVMVKNPINPDLELWIGALERINMAGVQRIAAIHRGFSHYGESEYRNKPLWEIPIELRRQFPELPVICDPSHISGKRELLAKVAQRAFDLNFDGIMIEAHRNPDKALSDARQQVTPERYDEIIDSLKMRKETIDDEVFLQHLEDLRKAIDEIDADILASLGKRMDISSDIGRFKKANNVAILQPERWAWIFENRTELGMEEGLSAGFLQDLLSAIHKESIKRQAAEMDKQSNPKMKESSSK